MSVCLPSLPDTVISPANGHGCWPSFCGPAASRNAISFCLVTFHSYLFSYLLLIVHVIVHSMVSSWHLLHTWPSLSSIPLSVGFTVGNLTYLSMSGWHCWVCFIQLNFFFALFGFFLHKALYHIIFLIDSLALTENLGIKCFPTSIVAISADLYYYYHQWRSVHKCKHILRSNRSLQAKDRQYFISSCMKNKDHTVQL